MIKKNQVARGVRVRLNEKWEEKSIGDKYLAQEPIIFISEENIYSTPDGDCVMLKGGSLTNSGYARLDQLDLEFPIPMKPMYNNHKDMSKVEAALLLQERDLIEQRLAEIDPNLLINHELSRYSKELKDIGFDENTKKFKH